MTGEKMNVDELELLDDWKKRRLLSIYIGFYV